MTRDEKKKRLSDWLSKHQDEIMEDVTRFDRLWDAEFGFLYLHSDDINHDLDLLNRCLTKFREQRTFN